MVSRLLVEGSAGGFLLMIRQIDHALRSLQASSVFVATNTFFLVGRVPQAPFAAQVLQLSLRR